MGLKSSIGHWLRNKLGVTQLEHDLQQQVQFSQALLQFSVPEVMIPDPQSLSHARAQISERYGIAEFNSAIHKNDLMFQHHLHKNPENISEVLFHYFNVGLDALNKIKDQLPDLNPACVLDFGAGYGRGSRFLPYFFPDAEVYVSELKQAALEFQSNIFGFTPVFHSEDPASFRPDTSFDLVMAISVFSHLPEESGRAWLKMLAENLGERGVLVFTYNSINPTVNSDYEYIAQSEDMGLAWVPDRIRDTAAYGSAFYSEVRMKEILNSIGLDFQLVSGFSGTQDAAICRKNGQT